MGGWLSWLDISLWISTLVMISGVVRLACRWTLREIATQVDSAFSAASACLSPPLLLPCAVSLK